jgi:nucleoside-diphosphate-sugar epimerase
VRALVTGGSGFLGGALTRALLERGDTVLALSRRPSAVLESAGAEFISCDITGPRATDVFALACARVDLVFHTAAKTGVWGRRHDFFAVNLGGTQALLAALARLGDDAPPLVHTSSPSVCFDGRDHRLAGPDLPRGTRFPCAYPESKAQAEEAVEDAVLHADLVACTLRPHLIYGPGDPYLLPRIVERARAGRLWRVGSGDNEVTLCFITHAVAAHIAVGDHLLRAGASAPPAGHAYFIGDAEPVLLWPWIDTLLRDAGLPPVTGRVSRTVATAVGAALEVLWRALRLRGEPPMTRFVAAELSTSHSYDMAPARHAFGYAPDVTPERARELALADLHERGLLP